MRRCQRGFSLLAYGLMALVVLVLLSGIAYKIRESGKDAVRVEWSAANEKARKEEAARAAQAAADLEVERGKKKIVYRKITETVDRYIDRPIYRNVCFDADGLRDANRALLGSFTDPSKPDGGMPAADRPR